MNNIAWDETLSVEVDEVDEDHRRLVDLFNLLSHSVDEGDDPEYIDALLEELISCTQWHFRHEERLMLRYQYPRREEHTIEHAELIKSVRELQTKFHQADKQLTTEDIDYLSNWLTEHILGHDMKMGFFLMEAM